MIDVKFAVSVFFSRKVMKRSAIVALIVGTILAFINHGDVILTASLTPVCWIKMIATCFVPYTVSSVTAVLGELEQRRGAKQVPPDRRGRSFFQEQNQLFPLR